MQNQNKQSDYAKASSDKPDNHIDYFAPKILWTILGILLLVVIVGSASWWKEIKNQPKIVCDPKALIDYIPGQCDEWVPNSSLKQNEDWKTYTNTEYGYEFKYPSEWKQNGTGLSAYFTKSPEIDVLEVQVIKKGTKQWNETPQSMISEHNCPGDHIIKQTPSGTLFVEGCSATSESYIYWTTLPSGDKLWISYQDNFETSLPEEQKLTILNQILSSFKFTNNVD